MLPFYNKRALVSVHRSDAGICVCRKPFLIEKMTVTAQKGQMWEAEAQIQIEC